MKEDKAFTSLLIALVPMAAVLVVFAFVESYALPEASNALCALSMCSLALSDQVERDLSRQREIARQETEIANQRASIMVIEMRPHFIYNTLTSVYCLCGQDPERARQVILDFTRYLRKNFGALSSSRPIPFSEELEHTRAYLAVEQAQYEDGLVVDFDTPHIRFRVPPLTLQPSSRTPSGTAGTPMPGPSTSPSGRASPRLAARSRSPTTGAASAVRRATSLTWPSKTSGGGSRSCAAGP